MVALVACSSTSGKPTLSIRPGGTKSVTPAPSQLVPEMLTWNGAASGTLSAASANCHNPPGDQIALAASDQSAEIGLPHHSAGVVDVKSFPSGSGTVVLHTAPTTGGFTLFVAVAGSVTYDSTGNSGSLDVWLAPQSNVPKSPSVHLAGRWRCE